MRSVGSPRDTQIGTGAMTVQRGSGAFGVGRSLERRRDTGQQSPRQAARRTALDAQAQRRRERAERDRRIEALAVDALTALEERKAAIAGCERRAGQALRDLTAREGLSVSQAADWCADGLTTREVRRLIGQLDGQDLNQTKPETVVPSVDLP